MARLPDLVQDSKLEATFVPIRDVTIHTYRESDPASRRRLVSRSEHWKRQRKIGAGSYASVWLEKSIRGQSRVDVRAVKQIDLSRGGHKAGFYNRELEAMAKFSHPKYERCFVKSYGWYESPESLYISMEYLEIGDLFEYLRSHEPLPEIEAREITYQLLDGLCMMHENGFAHRDLKPSNILIKSHPPDEWWVKISDFGISKRIDEERGNSTTLRGTPGYIAPELYGFVEKGSPYSVDIWSLGEIAFNIITKRTTFKTLAQLFGYAANHVTFPSNALVEAGATESAIDFISSLMQGLPDSRLNCQEAMSHNWMIDFFYSVDVPESPASDVSDTISIDSVMYLADDRLPFHTAPTPSQPIPETLSEEGQSALLAACDLLRAASTSCSRDDAVIGSPDSKIELYETLADRHRSVLSVSFSPDRRYVAVASDDKTVTIWDISRDAQLRAVREPVDPVRDLLFNPESGLLVCATSSGTELWSPPVGLKLSDIKPAPQNVRNIVISPDGKFLAFSTEEDTIGIRRFDGETDITIPIQSKTMMFTPDSRLLMVAAEDIFLWELSTGRIYQTQISRDWQPKLLAFSPAGNILASVSSFSSTNDEYIIFWDSTTGDQLLRIRNTIPNRVYSMVFSPNGKLFVTGELGGIHFWDVETGKELYRIEDGSPFENTNLTFSADGSMLLSCARAENSSPHSSGQARIARIKIWKGYMVQPEDT